MVLVNSFVGVKVLPKPIFANDSNDYMLSPEQIKFYEDNGFLVIKELIDFTSLYTYKRRFIQICNGEVPAGNIRIVREPSLAKLNLKPEDYINKMQELLFDDVFITYAKHPRLLSVLSQFIGDDITALHSMFINKPPGSSRHPPHQDIYYFPIRPAEKFISAWTAVDHVIKENGCLYVIPGSHKAQMVYEHVGKKDALKMYHGVDEVQIAPLVKRVNLEMSPGDTVFLHPYLLHGSGPNVSKNYRKAITAHFANSSCHYIDVAGTMYEQVAKEVEAYGEKLGFKKFSFIDGFRYKSKQVKGVRSNL